MIRNHTYEIEGMRLTFSEVRAELARRFPATAPLIRDSTLRHRLAKTTRWDRLGENPDAAQKRARDAFRSSRPLIGKGTML